MPKKNAILPGRRFGKLTTVSSWFNESRGRTAWKCVCDCGKEVDVLQYNLFSSKRSYGCGCGRGHASGVAMSHAAFYAYRRNANTRGVEFCLSESEFDEIASQNCFYCGRVPENKLKRPHNKGEFVYNGIDRLDNAKGYTKNNSVPCCKTCNRAKNNLTYDEFRDWLFRVSSFVAPLKKFGGKFATRITA